MTISNAEWAQGLIQQCIVSGVQHFCIAPGSRSAPLALAVYRLVKLNPIQLHTHFDERGLGFFALGLAKASCRPVIVITTSGTAVANLSPAVIEAWETDTPLMVFSADRPEQLINCGANQAIQQIGLFGKNIEQSLDISCPQTRAELHKQQQRLSSLLQLSVPAHINARFSEPLYASNKSIPAAEAVATPGKKSKALVPSALSARLQSQLLAANNCLIVLGSLNAQQAQCLLPWLEKLSCPIVADITSQFHFSKLESRLGFFDLALLNDGFKAACAPDLIIQFGGRLVSRRLSEYLSLNEAGYWLLTENTRNLDPSGRANRLQVCYSDFIAVTEPKHFKYAGFETLSAFDNSLADWLQAQLAAQWSEASLCARVCNALTGEEALFAGNSMAIRMLDNYCQNRGQNPLVFSNRGASGIDGLVASAAGCAAASQRKTLALIGDTSLLHDLNSLALLASSVRPIKLIVLNNDGGRIFGLLPAAREEAYEALFAMPHGYRFEAAAKLFGLAYRQVSNMVQLESELDGFLGSGQSEVLECVFAPRQGAAHIKTISTGVQCLTMPKQP